MLHSTHITHLPLFLLFKYYSTFYYHHMSLSNREFPIIVTIFCCILYVRKYKIFLSIIIFLQIIIYHIYRQLFIMEGR